MRQFTFFTLGLFLFAAACSNTPQENAITIVNAAAVDATVLERVRAFAERELRVPVRTVEKPKLAGKKSFQTLEKAAKRIKTDADVTLIVLSGFDDDLRHLTVNSRDGIALVNIKALQIDDAEKFARRIDRQVMRAAAFCFGMNPTPDPFCVTRDYCSLEDLDSMGRNFSPPWQDRFADEAGKRGLISSKNRQE